MSRGPFPRTVTRLCRDCGETWPAPRVLARPYRPSPWRVSVPPLAGDQLPRNAVMQAAAADVSARAAAVDAERARGAQLDRCPRCGSDHYDQRRA